MASIEQRLQALESKQSNPNTNGIVVIMDGELTESQQKQIDDAERIGQMVIKVMFISPDQPH